MKIKWRRILIILLLVFLVSFWWAGGNLVTKSIADDYKNKFTTITTKFSSLKDDSISIGSSLKRMLFLRQAVNNKMQQQQHYVLLREIPLTLQQALISVEDNRFYNHIGFDIEGILRATLVNLQNGKIVEGGSTITQQLVKNMFLTSNQTISRKAEELILALLLELYYPKEQILEMYFNNVYFGSNAYGISEAAKIYFNKRPADLTLAESSLLAGLPNAPSIYSPYEDFKLSKDRQAIVLQCMVRQGLISPTLANETKAQTIQLAR